MPITETDIAFLKALARYYVLNAQSTPAVVRAAGRLGPEH